MRVMRITRLDLEYDDEFHETEIKIIKDAIDNLQVAVKCIGDAIGKLKIRIKKIEDQNKRN